MNFDTLEERMKFYERNYTLPVYYRLPVCARVDGRNFSKYTSKLNKPYDETFATIMAETARSLLYECSASFVYTQSDEISLWWEPRDEIWFGGKHQKIVSHLAVDTTVTFNQFLNSCSSLINIDGPATFDARVWFVPSLIEGVNVFFWRKRDAIRNSVQMHATSQFSHKQRMNKSVNELKKMLLDRGIDWDGLEDSVRCGRAFLRNGNIITPCKIDNNDAMDEWLTAVYGV